MLASRGNGVTTEWNGVKNRANQIEMHQKTPLAAAAVSLCPRIANLTGIFGPHLSPSAQILLPTDANYTEQVTPRWTVWEQPSFIGAIQPATEDDVATTVKLCVEHELPFFTTGGGHGTGSGYGTVKDAVNIDLRNFRSVEVDAENNELTVGGATTAGQIYEPLYEAGKELPTGNSPCVGLVGVTIGGGIGTLQGKHGLMIDSLLSVRMVTARGDVVTASKTENPDLFWAIRGAGANFGIITSVTYRIYDATYKGLVVNADFEFHGSLSRSVWEVVKSFDEYVAPELSVICSGGWNPIKNESVVMVNAVYYGPEEEAKKHLAGFIELDSIRSEISTVRWPKLSDAAQFGQEAIAACVTGNHVNIYTLGLGRTDTETFQTVFEKLVAFAKSHPGFNGRFGIQRYSTVAALATPQDETVYPWRDIQTQVLLRNWYKDPSLDLDVDPFMEELRSLLASTSGFDELQPYLNYAHGDEGPKAWYGASNLPKLTELKSKWDPLNLFGRACPVPLSS